MNIAIIGAGRVGSTLGERLVALGHEVTYGVRHPKDAKYEALASGGANVRGIREAVATAEIAILATPWNAAEAALASAGDFAGKPLLDATNPIGPGLSLTHGHGDSGGEQVQRWAKSARVVKVFNTTGVENLQNPSYPAGALAMFLCGDDADACRIAESLVGTLGFEAVVVGELSRCRWLEPMAMIWIQLAVRTGNRNFGFGMFRRAAS